MLGGLAALTLLAALLLGGGQGWLGDRLLAVPGLCLLGLAAQRLRGATWARHWTFWVLPAALLGLPLLQLVPVPVSWVSLLPGRGALLEQMASIGAAPSWQSWSLVPFQTERVLWFACVPVGLYLATATLSLPEQRRLVYGLLGLAVLSALLGFIQVLQEPQNGWYFYDETNLGAAVGWFANRNHLASLLAAMVPVAAGLLVDRVRGRAGGFDGVTWWIAGALVVLALGVTVTRSRAGFGLLMLGTLLCVLLVRKAPREAGTWLGSARSWLQLTGVATVVAVVQFTLYDVLLRLEQDPADDYRWRFALRSIELAKSYAGLGTGLGTFAETYGQLGETVADIPYVVNHAHNDYLELWVEGGLPVAMFMALVLGLIVRALLGEWRAQRGSVAAIEDGYNSEPAHGLRLGCGIALLLFAFHSTVDYPLRTLALASLAAVFAGILLPCLSGGRDRQS